MLLSKVGKRRCSVFSNNIVTNLRTKKCCCAKLFFFLPLLCSSVERTYMNRSILSYFSQSSTADKEEVSSITNKDASREKDDVAPIAKKRKRTVTVVKADNDRFRVAPAALDVTISVDKHPWTKLLFATYGRRCRAYALPRDCVLVHVPLFLSVEECESLRVELDQLPMKEATIYEQPTPRVMLWQTDGTADQRVQYGPTVKDGESVNGHSDSSHPAEAVVATVSPTYAGSNGEYRFSGQRQQAHRMRKGVDDLKTRLNALLDLHLNSVLINKYRKEKIYDESGRWVRGAGKESIAPHRDKEQLFGQNPLIVSISIGQPRKFVIRYFEDSKVLHRLDFDLGKGDLLVMGDRVNVHCTHAIPKEENRIITDDRYSLTFRRTVALSRDASALDYT